MEMNRPWELREEAVLVLRGLYCGPHCPILLRVEATTQGLPTIQSARVSEQKDPAIIRFGVVTVVAKVLEMES